MADDTDRSVDLAMLMAEAEVHAQAARRPRSSSMNRELQPMFVLAPS